MKEILPKFILFALCVIMSMLALNGITFTININLKAGENPSRFRIEHSGKVSEDIDISLKTPYGVTIR